MREPRRILCAPFFGGYSFGAGRASKQATSVFDPASLSPTGWWRGSYGGSPWSDASGNSRTLTEATNPPSTGAAVNGYTPADYDGTNDILNGTAITTFFGTSGSIWCLFYADAAPSPVNDYSDGTMFGDPTNGECNLGFTTSGVGMCVLDDTVNYRRLNVACGTGGWHLAQSKWNGSNLYVRVDNGSWSSTACGPFTPISAGNALSGYGYTAAIRFDGRILDMGVKNAVISDGDFDNIRSYCNSRYGVSV